MVFKRSFQTSLNAAFVHNSDIPGRPLIPGNPFCPGGPIIPGDPSCPRAPALPLLPLSPGRPGDPGVPGAPCNYFTLVLIIALTYLQGILE